MLWSCIACGSLEKDQGVVTNNFISLQRADWRSFNLFSTARTLDYAKTIAYIISTDISVGKHDYVRFPALGEE